MDDEDDRHLLDFIGDVQALNDYLHGPNSKSIEEDDLTNAAYESASSFFSNDTGGSDEGLKNAHDHLEEFGEAGESGLSSSLQFIEDELQHGVSPSDEVDLGNEDQPFDILQKSLLEADITEQTLAEEALLESQPALCSAAANFPQQLVSGGLGSVSGTGLVAPMPLTGAQPQAFFQQVPQLPLPNGPTGQIQLLSSLNGSTQSMMTIKSLERPQILLRPAGNTLMGSAGQGTAFVPSAPGQVSAVPFNKGPIQLQNIIIQRGPVQQSLVRPIQPKALQTGGQTVYNISNLGIQPNTTAIPNQANTIAYTTNGSPQTTQQVKVVSQGTSIVVHSPFGQQGQPQVQASLPQGQFLLPSGSSVHGLQSVNGQMLQTNTQVADPSLTSTTTYSILTNQNTAVQIIGGQNFATGGQMVVNQSMVGANQIGQASPTGVMQVAQRPGVTAKVWTSNSSASPTAVQALQAPNPLTMVNSTGQTLQTHLQISVSPGQRLLVPVTQNNTKSLHTAVQETQFEKQQLPFNQDTLPKQKAQTQLANLLGTKGVKTSANQNSLFLTTSKRPENQQLSRGGMVLEQLRRNHAKVMFPERTPFTSLNDVIDRLLPYHVFQGEPPQEEDFAMVDEEFEAASTQVLMRTQSMVNKYRRLLMVEAERFSPSSEIVMIDRTFNQEERNNLTQDKRTVLVDPDGFLEEFCCGPKKLAANSEAMDSDGHKDFPSYMDTSPSQDTPQMQGYQERTECDQKPDYRTEACSASEDPGGGAHTDTFSKTNSEMKKKKTNNNSSSSQQHQTFQPAHYTTSPSQSQHMSGHFYPSELQSFERGHTQPSDTDSVLEAAVNSILDC